MGTLTLELPDDLIEKIKSIPNYAENGKKALEKMAMEIKEKKQKKEIKEKKWSESPSFGMWKDREDMEDTTAYVSNLRKPRYFLDETLKINGSVTQKKRNEILDLIEKESDGDGIWEDSEETVKMIENSRTASPVKAHFE